MKPRGRRWFVTGAIGVGILSGGSAAGQQPTVQFLATDPIKLTSNATSSASLLVARASAASPVEVRAALQWTSTNKDKPVTVTLQCGSGAVPTPQPTVTTAMPAPGTARSDTADLVSCQASAPVVAIDIRATGEGSGTGSLIAIDPQTGSTAMRAVAMAAPQQPVVRAPAKLTLHAPSMGPLTDEILRSRAVFPVSGGPLTGVASGTAGEAVVELSATEGAAPQFKVQRLEGYGNVVATFDVNGTAEGGNVEVTIYHRRPTYWAAILLGLGTLLASGLAAGQRAHQHQVLKDRHDRDQTRATTAYDGLLASVTNAPGLSDTTVKANWAAPQAVPALTGKELRDAQKLAKHSENVDAYALCCRLGTGLVSVYRFFHRERSQSALVNALRDSIHRGTGIDVSAAKTRLAADCAFAMEARSLYKALAAARQRTNDPVRQAELGKALDGVLDTTDLTARQPLANGWAVLYGTAVPPATMVTALSLDFDGERFIVGEPVPITVSAAPPAASAGAGAGALTGVSRLLGTKIASVVLTVLGLSIALGLELGTTFSANAGWGSFWDQMATFGRAFSVTGALQIARTLGAAASEG